MRASGEATATIPPSSVTCTISPPSRITVIASGDFPRLVRKTMSDDEGRGGEATASADPATLFAGMLERLGTDPLWAAEYRDYVRQVSFAAANEPIGFEQALVALRDLVALPGLKSGR